MKMHQMAHRVAAKHLDKRSSFRLSTKDKAVIEAFLQQQSASSNLLESDGKSLTKDGFGGEKVAVWRGSKIAVVSNEAVKSDMVIIGYLSKMGGKKVTFPYARKKHDLSIKFLSESDAIAQDQMRILIRALTSEGNLMGYVMYDHYPYNDGKGNYWIVDVKVKPEYRRSGVATALYKELFRREKISKRDLRPAMQTEDGAKFRSRAVL